ncbi:6625_t:CDS:1 [Paraglomus brasilianum]|uniref:histone acetyltransferase n=1 Tax=Paraglomus brasilianum TaxID=144538 RepID=A0A9N9G489_9GLOM|nr:6625_t:CDS:1 [Paraglomus brasilianum]
MSKQGNALVEYLGRNLSATVAGKHTYNLYVLSTTQVETDSPTPHLNSTAKRRRFVVFLAEDAIFITALEVHEYIEDHEENDTVSLYISKVDTTGFSSESGSPTKPLIASFLKYYIEIRSPKLLKINVFARAQPQYLFTKSFGNPRKRVLRDSVLVKWWKNVIAETLSTISDRLRGKTTAWFYIPGENSERSARILIKDENAEQQEKPLWAYGYPYDDDQAAENVIPRFIDDAKGRILRDVAGRDNKRKKIAGEMSVEEFWQVMAISGECGAGKTTGFFWVEITNGRSERDSEWITDGMLVIDDTEFSRVVDELLDLDFWPREKAIESTQKFIEILGSKCEIQEVKIEVDNQLNQFKKIDNRVVNNLQTSVKRKNPPSEKDGEASVNVLSPSLVKRKTK